MIIVNLSGHVDYKNKTKTLYVISKSVKNLVEFLLVEINHKKVYSDG